MASYRLSAKIGKSGKGGAHCDYILRADRYSKAEKDLVFSESQNLPTWAENAGDFWRAADKNERKNGAIYREFELTLPRELTPDQRTELVREWVKSEIGDRHAVTFAIHCPSAAIEGGEQPHAHIMYCERVLDGIDRSEEKYFSRYNAKNPEKGGARKVDRGMHAERAAALIGERERWEVLQNSHLEKHGHAARVDASSYKARGIDQKPEPHLGARRAKVDGEAMRARQKPAKPAKLDHNNPEQWAAIVAQYTNGEEEPLRENPNGTTEKPAPKSGRGRNDYGLGD